MTDSLVIKCDNLQFCSASSEVIFGGEPRWFKHIVTVNAEIFVSAHENPDFMRILYGTTNTIDGRVLELLCRVLCLEPRIRRLAGADMIYDLAGYCQRYSERLFLLGSTSDSLEKALAILRVERPSLQIAGFSPPMSDYPFPESMNLDILDRIAAFKPVHLVVCFGPVKQERWIHDNSSFLAQLGVRRAYGLGGTIDFVSSKRKRAPKVFQQMGIEWLFRLASEPRARFKRTLTMFRMPYYLIRAKREVYEANHLG